MHFSTIGLAALMAASVLVPHSRADISVFGADGSDGAFSPTSNVQVNLASAAAGTWNAPGTGVGVYDKDKWAVVYKYSSVNIPAGVTVTFVNHPSHAPVVWLVSGNVTINGTLSLNGQGTLQSGPQVPREPGPGGFRGGIRCSDTLGPRSGGFGPAGGPAIGGACSSEGNGGGHQTAGTGRVQGGGASDLTPTYGHNSLLPLVGGSGGAGSYYISTISRSGGSGGGAMLLAASGVIAVHGSVTANGGDGAVSGGGGSAFGGAGGGIRLVATEINGTGTLRALGGLWGGDGRIRLEGGSTQPIPTIEPLASTVGAPIGDFVAFPSDPSNSQSARIVSIAGQSVTSDPLARIGYPTTDVQLPGPGTFPVEIVTRNVNLGQNPAVLLRVVPTQGADQVVSATFVSGTNAETRWSAEVPFALSVTNILQATGTVTIAGFTQPARAISREVSVLAPFCSVDLDSDGDFTNGGTPDGAVTIDDLLFFLVGFEAGDVRVDLDSDGNPARGTPDGAVTIDDLLFFLARFEAGC